MALFLASRMICLLSSKNLFSVLRHWNPFSAEITLDCIERKVLHPVLINVVQHREPKAFQVGMFADEGLKGFGLDVFFGLDFNGDNSLFGLDGEVAYGLYETATQVVSRRYLVSYHTNSDE